MVQSYKTSAHILRYQACDPKLEEDVLKPISIPTMNFRGTSAHFHGCDRSQILPDDQSQTSGNDGCVQYHHLTVSLTHVHTQ